MNTPRRSSFSRSDSSTHAARRKLRYVRTVDYEPLRRRLEQLEREFDRLVRQNAEKKDKTEETRDGDSPSKRSQKTRRDGGPVSFDDWESRLQKLMEDCDVSIEKVEKRRQSLNHV